MGSDLAVLVFVSSAATMMSEADVAELAGKMREKTTNAAM